MQRTAVNPWKWSLDFGFNQAEIIEGFGLTEAAPVVTVNTAIHGRDGTVEKRRAGPMTKLAVECANAPTNARGAEKGREGAVSEGMEFGKPLLPVAISVLRQDMVRRGLDEAASKVRKPPARLVAQDRLADRQNHQHEEGEAHHAE